MTEAILPDDLPEESGYEIRTADDGTNDPRAVGLSIGKWEWQSLEKRPEAEFTVGGTEVHVVKGAESAAVEFEGGTRDPERLEIRIPPDQFRSVAEHGSATFDVQSGTFPFPVTVVRRGD